MRPENCGVSPRRRVDLSPRRFKAPGMRFFSDNAAAACPEVMSALHAANSLDTAYDGDRWSQRLDSVFSDLFETQVSALWVATGTAANCLALGALCPPEGSIVCHRDAHIQNDECGAPEFYTHGAKLMLAEGEGAKLTPESVTDVLATIRNDVHQVQPRALSITNATEYGLVYTPDEVAALGALCRERGLGFHMDGARFANAVVRSGASVADLTWRAGVDALSFGFASAPGTSCPRAASWPRRCLPCSRTTFGCATPAPPTTPPRALPLPRRTGWSCPWKPTNCSSASPPTKRSGFATRASTSTIGAPAKRGW
jgi:hypothetical protein